MSVLTKLTVAQIKENKKRTALTTISIAGIVSLLTAMALFLSSAWVVMHDAIIDNSGDWHFRTGIVKKADIEQLNLANFIDKKSETLAVDTLSSDVLPKGRAVFGKTYTRSMSSIGLTRYDRKNAVKQKEILISAALQKENLVGQTVTFTNSKGQSLAYFVKGLVYLDDNAGVDYVGVDENYDSDEAIVFGKVTNFDQYFERFNTFSKSSGISIAKHNQQLLALYLVTSNEVLNNLLSGVVPVIFILVLVISVVVISSSFMLSLNERLKQLGALSSVGVTRGQLVKMMLAESAIIGSIGIVIGLIVGFIGTSIALVYFDQYAQVVFKSSGLESKFSLVIYWPLIVAVILLSIIVIAVSAIIPALKSAKRSPIENIKQVPFKKLMQLKKRRQNSRRNVLARIFKQPAYLAYRYKKNNSSRARTVFFVLTTSLLTFNVISNLVIQLTDTVEQVAQGGSKNSRHTKGDISLYMPFERTATQSSEEHAQQLFNKVKTLNGVESVQFVRSGSIVTTQPDILDYVHKIRKVQFSGEIDQSSTEHMSIISLDETSEREFLQAIDVTPEQFQQSGVIVTTDFVRNKKISAIPTDALKGKSLPYMTFTNDYQLDKTSEKSIHILRNVEADKLSVGVSNLAELIVSKEMYYRIVSKADYTIMLKVDKNKADEIAKILKELANDGDYGNFYVNNIQENLKVMRAVLGMMGIIVYGFLSLISLVCLTTFYNTISSSARLRRREFAMLQSVGMTRGQLRIMLSIENMTAGILSIVFASIGAYALTILANIQGSSGVQEIIANMKYPILPTIISSCVLLVILLLFNVSTQRSVLKRSLVEDIKNETL
ncbi:FtsX-like permease family protein [Carnobacteriaceae bacterium zg-ZUI252]|nr:FtsX-like permease family protein [Carnobacteriaceae bacterium zg-ZUI252]